MSPPDRRRRTLRTHLVLTSAIATAGFGMVIALSLFVPVMTHFASSERRPEDLAGVADHLLYLHAGFWPVVAIALLASVVSGVVLFERMKAPLVRFVRVFQAIEGGRLPAPIRIRSTDYLQEEADVLNRMLEALHRRSSALHEGEARLREALGELERTLSPSRHSELEAVRKSASDLRAQLDDPSCE